MRLDHSNETRTLSESKQGVSALAYALRRLIDFEAAWIAYFPDFEDKICIGLSLDSTAQALLAASHRLEEQITVKPVYIASESLAQAFNIASAYKDLNKIRAFIYSMSDSILQTSKRLKKELDPLYDQPGLAALRTITEYLEDKILVLEDHNWNSTIAESFQLEVSNSNVDTWREDTFRPELLKTPARPSVLIQSDQSILNAPSSQLIESQEGIQRLLHFIYADIEVLAAEVCAYNIAEYGQTMPLQFIADMARQCADEARHAIMVGNMLEAYGGKLGDFTYTNRVWTSYSKGRDLPEKLAIQQIIDEGNGLDSSASLIAAFAKKDMRELVKLYQFLLADETVHCAFGNRWMQWLVDYQPERYEAVIDAGLEIGGSRLPGGAPLNLEGRRAAEYPDWFIDKRLAPRHT